MGEQHTRQPDHQAPHDIHRIWLGRAQPLMPAAAAWLLNQLGVDDLPIASFERTAVVCSTGRSCRILLGELVDRAQAAGLALVPPVLLTPGEVGESILLSQLSASDDTATDQARLRVAAEITRELIWSVALRDTPEVSEALLAHPPPREDLEAWLRHARMISRVSDELAQVSLRFRDVAPRLEAIEGFPDLNRWLAAAAAQDAYESCLSSRGLFDPMLACLGELESPSVQAPRPVFDRLVLVGSVRLSPVARRALERVGSVYACVHAPSELHGAFADDGSPLAEIWSDPERSPLAISSDQIQWTRSASDAAELALLGACAQEVDGVGDFDPSRGVLVATDPNLMVELGVLEAEIPGMQIRDAMGEQLVRTPPARALAAVLAVHRDEVSGIRASLRSTLLCRWLCRTCELAENDLDTARHAVDRVLEACPTTSVNELQTRLKAGTVGDTVIQALCALSEPFGHATTDAANAPAYHTLLDFLQQLHIESTQENAQEPDAQEPDIEPSASSAATLHAAIDTAALDQLLACVEQAAEAIETLEPSTDATSLASLVLQLVRDQRVPPPVRTDALDLLGWAELAADPRERIAILGMTEGTLSRPSVEFALLTENARQMLGLSDDRTRLAEDACSLWSAMGGRERLVIVVPKETPEGQPLTPSRLLFFGAESTHNEFEMQPDEMGKTPAPNDGDAELALAKRVLCAVDPEPVRVGIRRERVRDINASLALSTQLAAARESYSVSSFSSYLRSPALYYLERALKAQSPDPERTELDARTYGSVLHDTLRDFHGHRHAASTDHERVRSGLLETFEQLCAARFGDRVPAAIRVQLELARHRLERVAAWHAAQRNAGWLTERVEWDPADASPHADNAAGSSGIPMLVDDTRAWIRGRIDRIDRHEDTGAMRVLDYKTSEQPVDPARRHIAGGGWVDLQLPLYRWMVDERQQAVSDHSNQPLSSSEIEIGYVSIHRGEQPIEFAPLALDEQMYSSALRVAGDVIRAIRTTIFREHPSREHETITDAGRLQAAKRASSDGFSSQVMHWLRDAINQPADHLTTSDVLDQHVAEHGQMETNP